MAEIRRDIITDNYVIIATKRGKRPHDYTREKGIRKKRDCPFCPGNEQETPPEVTALRDTPPDSPGWTVRVVPNKFAAVNQEDEMHSSKQGFYTCLAARGNAEVVIESPDHNISLGLQPLEQITDLLGIIKERYNALSEDSNVKYIQIFKNHGQIAGASLEHPHWQIISLPIVPSSLQVEYQGAEKNFFIYQECVYCMIIKQEERVKKRIIAINEKFLAFAPFASRFPFETWIIPFSHQNQFGELAVQDIQYLASIIKQISKVMEVDFNIPYNLVLHTAIPGSNPSYYHWHLEILPRLTTTAGFELGTGIYINPTTPEMAAELIVERSNNG